MTITFEDLACAITNGTLNPTVEAFALQAINQAERDGLSLETACRLQGLTEDEFEAVTDLLPEGWEQVTE